MKLEAKNIETPEVKRSFEHGTLKQVTVGGMTIGLAVYNPGWTWSADVKPLVDTESCQAAHTGYVISGRLRVRTDDGQEMEFGPGDAHSAPPGHDAWVTSDDPCVIVDFFPDPAATRTATCPCGIEFRIASGGDVEHLLAALRQHSSAAHGHDLTQGQAEAALA